MTRGEVEGGGDAGRVSRQPSVQPARRAHAPLQRGTSRRWRSGTITRSATTGIDTRDLSQRRALHDEEHGAARRARAAGVSRAPSDCDRSRQSATASIGRCRSGRSSRCSRSTCAASAAPTARTARPTLDDASTHPRRVAARVAEGAAGGEPRDLEGHRQRHADRRHRARRARPTSKRSPTATAAPPLGRELEIADLLRFIKTRRIRNVVWITGDMHYCAAHHYDPARARFTDFDPFWEFVAGPLHAGTFGPNDARRHVRARSAVHRRSRRA